MSNTPIQHDARQQRWLDFLLTLQDSICAGLEELDGQAKFEEDKWQRPGGGGGRTRVIGGGQVFEKGGVNFSEVYGELPESMQKQFEVQQGFFWAAGVSLVLHPENPHIPTCHANWRSFFLYDEPNGQLQDCWYAGGTDLTPYYLVEEDARHFHQVQYDACGEHAPLLYPIYKAACDEYFWNGHRQEARGVGGLFFDYLRQELHGLSLDQWEAFVKRNGEAFLQAFVPIAQRRKSQAWTEAQRYWQEIRRGRYAEFNLIWDKGTVFGLKTRGRTESILMSLPPRVRWEYMHQPAPDSPEAELLQVLQQPREWLPTAAQNHA